MRKKFGKPAVAIVLLLCVCCVAMAFMPVSEAKASGNEVKSTNFEFYTESDELLTYSGKTIADYENNLYATECRPEIDEEGVLYLTDVQKDDPIVEIVPKELFSGIGETLYIGKEYGFFIATEIQSRNTEIQERTLLSTVLVFDIETDTNLAQTTDRVIVSVSPLFQYKYLYLKAAEVSAVFSGNHTLNYNLSEDRVIPYPTSINTESVTFGMTNRFYLKDVSFGESLYNENNLNRFDLGYDPYTDNGSFFTAIDYTYRGQVRNNGEFPKNAVAKYIGNTALTVLSCVPVLSKAGALISLGKDTVSLCAGLLDNAFGTKTYESGELSTRCMYQNRDDQLANYKDENGNPFLTKTAAVAINTPSGESVWYGTGDRITGYFTVSHSALNGQTAEYTRLYSEIALKIVDRNTPSGSEDVKAISKNTFTYYLRDPETKKVTDGEVLGYTIGSEYDRFVFQPDRSDYYVIKNHGLYPLNFKVSDGNSVARYDEIAPQGKLRFFADLTKVYNIEVGGINSETEFHSFLLTVEWDPDPLIGSGKSLTLPAIASKWYRYTPTENKVTVFSSSNENIKMVVCDEEGDLLSTSASASLEILAKAGKNYYVCMQNPLSETQVSTLTYETKRSDVSCGTAVYSQEIYFLRKIDFSGTYKFEFSSETWLEIKIYDGDCGEIFKTNDLSFLYAFEKTGNYTIGVRCSRSASSAFVSYIANFYAEHVYFGTNSLSYNGVLEYNTYRFVPPVTARYSFGAENAVSVSVSSDIEGSDSLNGRRLLANSAYYVRVKSDRTNPTLNIRLTDCGTILQNNVAETGTYSSDENIFYKFNTKFAGKYSLDYINAQVSVYDRNLERVNVYSGCSFDGQENADYYFKLVGATGNRYSIKAFFDPTELKINQAQVFVADAWFKFVNDESREFIIKTFGEDYISSEIGWTTDPYNREISSEQSGNDVLHVVGTENTYYIFIDISQSGYIAVSVEYADPSEYFTEEYKIREAEMYKIKFLMSETKNYSVEVAEIDDGKLFEIRLLKEIHVYYALAVDGKFVKGESLEEGTVTRFAFELSKGNHLISIRYDSSFGSDESKWVSLFYMYGVESFDLYLTETETGTYARDGIRPGYEYDVQLLINGNIVSDYFYVKVAFGDVSVSEKTMSVDSAASKDEIALFRVNYAYVNYDVSVDILYPYRLLTEVEQTGDKILYKVRAFNYYTNEPVTKASCSTLADYMNLIDVRSFKMTVSVDSQKLRESELNAYTNDPSKYNNGTEFVFDISDLNYYADATIRCQATVKMGRNDDVTDFSTVVLPYRTSGSVNDAGTMKQSILFFDLAENPIDTQKYSASPIEFPVTAKVINLKGDGRNISFNGFKFSADVILNLYNVSFTGMWSGVPIRSDYNVTINALGSNEIGGCNGSFGTMSAMGTSAITVKNLTLCVPAESFLRVYAGTPFMYNYNGNVGTAGKNGADGADGTSDRTQGNNGEAGKNGGQGGTGSAGIAGVKCAVLDLSSVNGSLTIRGSVGCVGGKGGKGGNGGAGGNGCNTGKWWSTSGNGGNGGAGGKGGRGGTGGQGGAGVECVKTEGYNPDRCEIVGGSGGAGGQGGEGGTGGKAGNGGSKPTFGHAGVDGKAGKDGAKGAVGKTGETGLAVKYVQA